MSTPTPRAFRLAAVQMDVRIGRPGENLDRISGFARQAAKDGAELVVFPECALTGYCFESLAEGLRHSEPIPGPLSDSVCRLAQELGVHIVAGTLERDGDRLYNALILAGPRGLAGSYRKTHLPHLGVDHFASPGEGPLRVHDLPICRLGMSICYDGAFPETARVMALGGADLIVLPTNWPRGAEEFALYGINTRALENKVYYASVDRVGEERGFRFIGLSRIVDVHGKTLAEADGSSEVVISATIEPAEARVKRIDRVPGKHWIDRIGDRRPDLYGPLAGAR